jgi:hypothetical protein
MKTVYRGLVAGLFIAIVAMPASTGAQSELEAFQRAVDKYVALYRQIETELGIVDLSEHPSPVQTALRTAIRKARASARPGDVFTRPVGVRLKGQLKDALQPIPGRGVRLFDDVDEDERPDPPPLRVNDAFPWSAGPGISATAIAALPPLPPPLEYRFVRRDLVLVDVTAGLIVDVLREALPAPEGARSPDPSTRR